MGSTHMGTPVFSMALQRLPQNLGIYFFGFIIWQIVGKVC
jgi:hypothetical protein